MTDAKSPVERLLDLSVFAPLGLLLTREQTMNDLAAVGRKQVAFARSLGKAALKSVTNAPRAPSSRQPAAPGEMDNGEIDTGAIEGYASMTARELVSLVRSCSPAQAEWLRAAEERGKKRVTVIRALDERARS